jgi:hypothetical protein
MENEAWCQLFPNARLECLATTTSDHYPLWLVPEQIIAQIGHQRKFKFKHAWLVEHKFKKERSLSSITIVTKEKQNCPHSNVEFLPSL